MERNYFKNIYDDEDDGNFSCVDDDVIIHFHPEAEWRYRSSFIVIVFCFMIEKM